MVSTVDPEVIVKCVKIALAHKLLTVRGKNRVYLTVMHTVAQKYSYVIEDLGIIQLVWF